MFTNNKIPVIKYKVFKIDENGLLKSKTGTMNEPYFFKETFTSIMRAAQAVLDEGYEYSEFVILPIASWEEKED